jgi:putative FmdB family regulatory protein
MPIYEYKCGGCSHEVEKLTKFNAKAPWCEKCATPMEKKISKGSFSLKGGGWYADGYSAPSPTAPANSE